MKAEQGVYAIIGGQDYHGHTAERDKKIAELVGRKLFEHIPKAKLAIGGTPGIPMDIARAFMQAGASPDQVKAFVSRKYEAEFLQHNEKLGVQHEVVGETQEDRRKFLPTIPDLRAAIALQGGQYTTHELKLFEEHNIRIVAVRGSGGASGGVIAWNDGYTYNGIPKQVILCSEDPEESPEKMADAVIAELMNNE